MKYTNYLKSNQFIKIESLHTESFYFKPILLPVSIVVSIMGIGLIAGLYPPAYIVDKIIIIKNLKFN